MDIKSFGAKLSVFWEKAAVVGNSMLEKAGKITGEMLEKTADFTYDKIKTSPLCLINGAAFDEVRTHRNLVVFVVGDREDAQSKAIIGRVPLLASKAWQFGATLKIIYAQDLPDLVQALGASTPSALVYREGTQKYMLTGEKLDAFVESFDIFCNWNEYAAPATTSAPEWTVVLPTPDTTSPETPPKP